MIPTKDDLIYEVCTVLGRSEDDAVLSLVDKLLLMFEHQKNLQQTPCTTYVCQCESREGFILFKGYSYCKTCGKRC